MPNLIPMLNEHVCRLARREIKSNTRQTRKATAQYRRDIAALKRQVKDLASRLSTLEKTGGRKDPAVVAAAADPGNLRFRADGLRTHRAKLGLSAHDYGRLVGVSGLTIYHWEAGKSKPRRKVLPALASVRSLGKKEALQRLQTAA
ncbi:MAG TPA: helix-turn-helix domain-containing protein [Phycisphaerae bacterium]|jgi:DNA-binding XRE family transcriptional regulator|nr:helix-turn-helix domain-containing protein [Phycisphaerae bacterium]